MNEILNAKDGAIAKLRDAKILINDAQQTLARVDDQITTLTSLMDRLSEALNDDSQSKEDAWADLQNIQLEYYKFKKMFLNNQ